jgi:4'-phosphopantetheinyl transferase
MREALEPGQAHLWYVWPDTVTDPKLLRTYEGLLSEDERRQKDRFHFAEGRHQYLLSRALVRTTLSRYADVRPEEWRFTKNEHGRPEVAGPEVAPWPRFSLSHTRGFIACLVALDGALGVDVENTERHGDLLEIADRHFSPLEVRALRALPRGAQTERFFEYWTLKESLIKALGVGISFGLSNFSFHLDGGPIRVFFEPGIPQDPRAWRFTLQRPGPRHILAASVRRQGGEVDVVPRETIPLARS